MGTMMRLGRSVYGRFVWLANRARSPLLLAIRLYWAGSLRRMDGANCTTWRV